MAPETGFSHPVIFHDLHSVFRYYYMRHTNYPKIFRIAVGESILANIESAKRLVIVANLSKANIEDLRKWYDSVKELRAFVEILKTQIYTGWELGVIPNPDYAHLSEKLESVSKQASKWAAWFSLRCT